MSLCEENNLDDTNFSRFVFEDVVCALSSSIPQSESIVLRGILESKSAVVKSSEPSHRSSLTHLVTTDLFDSESQSVENFHFKIVSVSDRLITTIFPHITI